MDNINNNVLQEIRKVCEKGYATQDDILFLQTMASRHGIKKADLDKAVKTELQLWRENQMNKLVDSINQPQAAYLNHAVFSSESVRRFPEILYVGEAQLSLNPNIKVPAYLPVKDTFGVGVIHDNNPDAANNILKNTIMRLLFSLPRDMARVTIIDSVNVGSDFADLYDIDRNLCSFISTENDISSFWQNLSASLMKFKNEELRNTYDSLEEYNRKNPSKSRPSQLIVIPDFPNGIEESAQKEIKWILKLAPKMGVFFMVSVNCSSVAKAQRFFDNKDLCLIDMSDEKKVKIISQQDPVDFFNNAFVFSPQTKLAFSDKDILQFNHEFDPKNQIYALDAPVEEVVGENSIFSLKVNLGNTESKGKPYQAELSEEKGHILTLANDNNVRKNLAGAMLESITGAYRQADQLQLAGYNIDSFSITVPQSQMFESLATDVSSLHALLERLEKTVEDRKTVFDSSHVNDFKSYRGLNEAPMYRIACLFDLTPLVGSFELDALDSLEKIKCLMAESNRYGIHFLLYWTVGDHVFSVVEDYKAVGYNMLVSMTEKEMYDMGFMEINPDEKKYQMAPQHALSITGTDVVKLQIVNNKIKK